MPRQFSVPYQIPPDTLLPAAADAAGRTSPYVSLRGVHKAWIICLVNQGNAATVALTVLQAQDSSGTGAKALTNNCPIWANQATAAGDGNTAQAAGANFTTSAALADKRVIFEITPDMVMDVNNGFNHIAIQTGASNAANITAAIIERYVDYQQAAPPTDRV